VSMRVLDEKGQPVQGAKMAGDATSDVPESMQVVPMQFGVTLNRAGRFTLELTATDNVTGATAKVSYQVAGAGAVSEQRTEPRVSASG